MRVQDCNWMQLEEYLRGDDRIVLPFGSIERAVSGAEDSKLILLMRLGAWHSLFALTGLGRLHIR